MKSIKNILVTTDFSKESEFALEEAALLAKKFHSNLIMLNTVDRIQEFGADYAIPVEVVMGMKERMMKDARKQLNKKVVEVESKYQIKAMADVRYGDIYDEILKEEDEKEIDLVVIAPHEKKSWGGRLFSHLSDKLAKNSHCDTLLVRQHG
jgi:nucleotide-binding universal stress UspA family protein